MKKIIKRKKEEKETPKGELGVGTKFIVTGPHHFEEARVTSINKDGNLRLNNNLVIDRNLNVLNSNMNFRVHSWSEENMEFITAQRMIPSLLDSIRMKYESWGKNDMMIAYKRLKKIANF